MIPYVATKVQMGESTGGVELARGDRGYETRVRIEVGLPAVMRALR